MSASDWQQLEPLWNKLQSYYGETRGSLESPLVQLSHEAQAGINQQFTIIAGKIAELKKDGRLGKGVIDGTTTVAQWLAVANAQGQGLASISKQVDEENYFKRSWTELVIPTAKGVGDVAQQVAQGSQSTLLIVAVILVALVALKVLR